MKSSNSFSLPYLSLHQSLKELTINEAISEIDSLIANPILKVISSLPSDPEDCGIYLVKSPDDENLEGKDNYLAMWINSHWKYIKPRKNMVFYSLEHSKNIFFRDEVWNF